VALAASAGRRFSRLVRADSADLVAGFREKADNPSSQRVVLEPGLFDGVLGDAGELVFLDSIGSAKRITSVPAASPAIATRSSSTCLRERPFPKAPDGPFRALKLL